MASLPAAVAFNGSTVTQAQFRAAQAQMRTYLAGLLGTDGSVATARSLLGLNAEPTTFNSRGNYAQDTEYAVFDLVASSNGLAYLNILGYISPISGGDPSMDTVHWQLQQGVTLGALASTSFGQGVDLVKGATRGFASVEDLLDYPKPVPVGTETITGVLNAYYAGGDVGGGPVVWRNSSTAAHDGGHVFNPVGNAGAGRWHRPNVTKYSAKAADFGILPDGNELAPDGVSYSTKMQALVNLISGPAKPDSVGGTIRLSASEDGYVMGWVKKPGVFVFGSIDGFLSSLNGSRGYWVVAPAAGGVHIDWPAVEGFTEGTATFSGGLYGLGLFGPGAETPCIGVRVRDARCPTLYGCYFDGYADEGVVITNTVRIGNFRRLLGVNCLLDRSRSAPSYAFDCLGGDCVLDDIEFGPSLGGRTDANLRVRGIRIGGDNNRWSKIIGEKADVSLVIQGSNHHGETARAEFSFGDNCIVECTNSELGVIVSTDGSKHGAGLYDGIRFESGATLNSSTMLKDITVSGPGTRYGIYEGAASGGTSISTQKNRHKSVEGFGQTLQLYFSVTEGAGLVLPDGDFIQLEVNSATPTVQNWKHFRTNNTSATSITQFLRSFPGQMIHIIAGDSNTTLVHDGVNLVLPGSANLVLVANRYYTLVRGGNAFRVVSVSP